ncbi:MAG: DUF3365 domain-containing protein [Nitrospinaceae bacterium]
MANKFLSFITLLVFLFSLGAVPAWSGEDESIAKELTILLKASRAVLVQNKPLIKNPKGAGIGVDKFLSLTYANYEKATGKKFKMGGGNMGKAQGMLIEAIKGVVGDVVSGKDTALDPKGRFLPAIFARKAATRFGKTSGGKMYLKLTTQDKFLVNPSNKADGWEKGVIEGKFLKAGWEKGKTFSEMAKHNGKNAFRLILPEYFKKGCMGCHGGDNGAKIHPGKVGGSVGELGGAISVAIYK